MILKQLLTHQNGWIREFAKAFVESNPKIILTENYAHACDYRLDCNFSDKWITIFSFPRRSGGYVWDVLLPAKLGYVQYKYFALSAVIESIENNIN